MKKGKPGVSSSSQPKVTSNSDHGLNNPVQKPVFKTLNTGNNADTIQTFDDDDEWELGVGNLIIDLDADLERNDPSPALQPQVKAEMEHQATVDKGLKMKIKRKTLKTPEAGAAGASKVGKDAKMINDSKNKRAVVKKEKSKKDQAQNGLNHTKSDDPYEFNAKVEDRIRVPVKKTTKAEKAATPPSSPTPKSSQAADLPVPVETTERKHACTETMDMSTCTEPEFLGPCEPGTSVMLGGIVWQETENGVLVVNVTWRGKTYVGTLLDATRHDWAPPRFNCESPTSETPKGRGVKRNCRAGVGTPENIIETRKLRKGRRGVVRNFQAPPSPAKSDITPISSAKRKQRSAEMDVNDDVKKRARSISRGTPTEPEPKPNSQGYIECPEANCSKKYRHMNGLKYHQSHAHSGNMEGEDSSGSRPATPVTPSVTDRIKEFEFEETQDNAEEEQTDANENKADHNHIENKEKEEEPVKEDEEVVDEEKPNENPEEIENVHSPAYSDISDAAESAPVEKTAEPDAKPAKEVHVPTPVSGFNAFTYYGQKPYLIPAMGEKQPLKSPNTTESSHRAEAFHDEFGDNKPTTSQPLFSPGQQPIITSFGFMGKPYIGPAEQFRDDEAQKAQQARLSDEQKQKDTPPATERPQRPADAEKPGSSTATSSPADNVQKPEIRIKSEPRDPLLERHQEDLKRFYMYQKQKQHDQRAEEAERYDERMRSVMKIKQEPTSADRPEPDKPEKEVFKPDLKRPSSPQEKSVIQEKRSKPTMPSPATTPKSKPPTPTLLPPYGQFAVAPNLIQGPYGPVQIDPHSPYRVPGGINGPLLGFPGSPAYMHPALRYHVPPMEKEKQMMMSPGARHLDQPKALDLLQQHASHYYNSSQHHKIHELERAGRPDSGTPPKSRAGPSPVSVVAPKDIAGLHASPRHMSPPPQRHVHTHHHTHLMGGYPLYDPYGAMINAGQGPSPLPPGAIGHPAFPPK